MCVLQEYGLSVCQISSKLVLVVFPWRSTKHSSSQTFVFKIIKVGLHYMTKTSSENFNYNHVRYTRMYFSIKLHFPYKMHIISYSQFYSCLYTCETKIAPRSRKPCPTQGWYHLQKGNLYRSMRRKKLKAQKFISFEFDKFHFAELSEISKDVDFSQLQACLLL